MRPLISVGHVLFGRFFRTVPRLVWTEAEGDTIGVQKGGNWSHLMRTNVWMSIGIWMQGRMSRTSDGSIELRISEMTGSCRALDRQNHSARQVTCAVDSRRSEVQQSRLSKHRLDCSDGSGGRRKGGGGRGIRGESL
jgi:hypothetical protein